MRGKPSEHEQAEAAVREAQEGMSQVRDRITGELHALKRDQAMLRQELTHAVDSRATQGVLIDLTKKCQQVEKQINDKQKLLANVSRQTTQLSDTGTNAKVAAAYMQSVEAQENLTKLALGGSNMADVLDRVADLTEETQLNTEELAHMGGLDDDLDPLDETNFDSDAVMRAMGLRTDYKEDITVQEIKAKMHEHWQPDKPTQPIDIPVDAAAAASLFRIGSQYNTSSNVNPSMHSLRQRHGQTYDLPQAPGIRAANTTYSSEEEGVAAMRAAALAPPRTEY